MKGLKYGAILSFIVAMGVLLLGGYFAKERVAPYPGKVAVDNNVIFTSKEIKSGQVVYQKYGLMDHGSVWGHGSLRGMDFSALTLHMIGSNMRDFYSAENGKAYKDLTVDEKAVIDARVISEIKQNTYNASSDTLNLTKAGGYAIGKIKEYWTASFKDGDKATGFLPETVKTDEERQNISYFFYWTAWVAGTNRPDENITYTNNWPPDRSVGNDVHPDALLWSILSIIGLFIVLGGTIYIIHRFKFFYGEPVGVDLANKLISMPLTGSQIKAAKFFLVVALLFIAQLLVGGLLAHYTVSPGTFYFNMSFISDFIPYSLAKTWHLQLAIFWIATSWVGTAIYLAPIIGGKEPKGQGILVNILFAAILLVAVGSLAGEALGIKGLLGNYWFMLGHQGWEYLELGRLWQILLFGGLIAWLFIVYRALKGRLYGPDKDESGLIWFYTLSAILVVAFFGFGLAYDSSTHLTIADYWRWFVVHIWVEGIFEFFGVAIIALFLVTLGLVNKESAARVAFFTAILVFLSGIIGTAHHYFWYGGPSFWLPLGSIFSSLEPVPLIILVVRAWMEYKSINDQGKEFPYRWPLLFLVASSFWNFLGAGVFGFAINLPVINYYEHATYLTANHGHTALFGVYGMLGIAVLLFSWRSLVSREYWSDKLLKVSFYGLNIGLFLMFLTYLLPVGIMQLISSYADGFWFARSNEFYTRGLVQALGLWRMVPDTIIIVFGALPLLFFLLKTYFKMKPVGYKEGQSLFGGKHII